MSVRSPPDPPFLGVTLRVIEGTGTCLEGWVGFPLQGQDVRYKPSSFSPLLTTKGTGGDEDSHLCLSL